MLVQNGYVQSAKKINLRYQNQCFSCTLLDGESGVWLEMLTADYE